MRLIDDPICKTIAFDENFERSGKFRSNRRFGCYEENFDRRHFQA